MNMRDALEQTMAVLTADLDGDVTVETILRAHRHQIYRYLGAFAVGATFAATIAKTLAED